MNNRLRKFLCKIKWHDDDLISITIKPVVVIQKFDENEGEYVPENLYLPEYPAHIWKCKHCGNQRSF